MTPRPRPSPPTTRLTLLAFCALLGAVPAVAGCDAEAAPAPYGSLTAHPAHAAAGSTTHTSPLETDTLDVASSEPVTFPLGHGKDPEPEEVSRLDIDVKPDGTGLPPGSGTVDEGAEVYRARCAACHGPEGEGTPAGWPLVGRNPGDAFDFHESLDQELRRTIGNYWPYAATLFDYTRRTMPYDAPGSLTDDEVYAVTAWLLWRNRIIGPEEVMNAETLPNARMPSQDRFIPDDRPR